MHPREIAREKEEGVEIDLSVRPGSARPGVEGLDPWRKRLVVRVSSQPRGGEANRELGDMLGEMFSSPVEIVRGQGGRMKTVLVHSDLESVVSRLEGSI
ncbi:MAG: DUF167 domain-containing protein [Methanomassiliicoccales archaeon]